MVRGVDGNPAARLASQETVNKLGPAVPKTAWTDIKRGIMPNGRIVAANQVWTTERDGGEGTGLGTGLPCRLTGKGEIGIG